MQYAAASSTYLSALDELLKQLPQNTALLIGHEVTVTQGFNTKLLHVNETVELEYNTNFDYWSLKFTLSCQQGDNTIRVSSYEDFGIVYRMLKDKLSGQIETCAYCSKSDFKSDGGEDLRHGWYCFRENSDLDMSNPWYERLDEFDHAIPNISAFYWCPSFSYKNKTFA